MNQGDLRGEGDSYHLARLRYIVVGRKEKGKREGFFVFFDGWMVDDCCWLSMTAGGEEEEVRPHFVLSRCRVEWLHNKRCENSFLSSHKS